MSGAVLPDGARALIDTPEFAVLSTANPDGSHHLCVMWVARDGDALLMATRRGRPQHRNLLADPRATVLVYSRTRPTSFVQIRGVASFPDLDAGALIGSLSHAYTGTPHDTPIEDPERVAIRIDPSHVVFRP